MDSYHLGIISSNITVIARSRVSNTRFLYTLNISKAITLDSAETDDVTDDMAAVIMLYRFISSALNVNTLG